MRLPWNAIIYTDPEDEAYVMKGREERWSED